MAINYVRFQRGDQAAYDYLKAQGQLDPNTLYFIMNSGFGALYMGEISLAVAILLLLQLL